MSERIDRNSLLIQGLQRIIETGLELPLVPLNGKKQPLGDGWQNRPFTAAQLIEAIKDGGVKVPITDKKTLEPVIKKLPLLGFGILLGRPINVNGVRHYLLAVDQDGTSAAKLIEEVSGGVGIPKTVTFASGRPGRCQYLLLVPEKFAPSLRFKKLKTGVKGDDNKDEALEFRWLNQQSVLPPSVHPITGGYFYVDGCALGETEMAIAPNWVIEQMIDDPNPIRGQLMKLALHHNIEVKLNGEGLHQETLQQLDTKVDLVSIVQQKVALRRAGKDLIGKCPFHKDQAESLSVDSSKNLYYCYDCGSNGSVVKFVEQFSETISQRQYKKPPQIFRESVTQKRWTQEDYVRSYLESLSPSRVDDYHDWVAVGMALHSLGEQMLPVWVQWSQQSSKYKSGECEKKWLRFSASKGVGLGTLAHMAKQDGWESPFKKQPQSNYSRQDNSSSPKMPIAEAVEQARQILTSNRSKVEQNTLLEELRTQVGLSSRDWSNSFIRPLKQEFSSQRLKLEVAAYVQESDPFEQIQKKGQICSTYRINSFDLKFLANKLEQEEETPKKIVWSFDEFFNQETNALKWIIPGMLPVGEMILLAALSKTGKTLLATDVIYGVLSGTKVLDCQVGVKGKVLLITSDESEFSTKRRLGLRGFDLLPERNNLRIVTHLDLLNLTTLEEQLEEFRPQLVVIDSLTSITDNIGVSEKDTEFARYVYRLKNLIGRYGAASILIHHENKDKEAKGINKVSGSARIPAAVWGIWQMLAADPDNDQDPRRWLKIKPREGESIILTLSINPKDLWASEGIFEFINEFGDESGEKKSIGERVLNVLKQYSPKGLEYRELNQILNIGRSLYTILDRLEDRQLITKRRSLADQRRWVYAVPIENLPQEAGLRSGKENNDLVGDTPPPQEVFSGEDEFPKSVALSEFQFSQHLVNSYSTVTQQLLNTHTNQVEVLTNSSPEIVKDSTSLEDSQHIKPEKGGVGHNTLKDGNNESQSYCSQTPLIENELPDGSNVDTADTSLATTSSTELAQIINPNLISVYKEGDKVNYVGTDKNKQQHYGGKEMVVHKVNNKDEIACRLPNGQITTWLVEQELAHCQAVEAKSEQSNTSTNVAIDVSEQDIQDAVTALEYTVDEPRFIEVVKEMPRIVITAAWQYLNQTQGHQAVTQLYQRLSNLFADSENVWGLDEDAQGELFGSV